jgi:hypothetical protein
VSSQGEEELVNVPFHLHYEESTEFVVGRIEQGDTLKILITSDNKDDEFNVVLVGTCMRGDSVSSRTLFDTTVKSGTTVTYRIPFGVDETSIKVIYSYAPPRADETNGNLRVCVIRASSRVLRCSVCGSPAEPGAKYCGMCGTKLK